MTALALSLLALASIGFLGADAATTAAFRGIAAHSRFFHRFFWLVSFPPLMATLLFGVPLLAVYQSGISPLLLFPAILAPLLAQGLTNCLKYTFQRTRPDSATTYLGSSDSSFPSGHSAASFATAHALALILPSWAGYAYGLATLTAFSRLYLGKHHLSDVASGTLLGLLMAELTFTPSFQKFLALLSL